MSLRNDKRQNIQFELDLSSQPMGEARQAGGEEPESFPAVNGPESPDGTYRLIEEVCERENLKEALRRVKAHKGGAGVDGMISCLNLRHLLRRAEILKPPSSVHFSIYA